MSTFGTVTKYQKRADYAEQSSVRRPDSSGGLEGTPPWVLNSDTMATNEEMDRAEKFIGRYLAGYIGETVDPRNSPDPRFFKQPSNPGRYNACDISLHRRKSGARAVGLAARG